MFQITILINYKMQPGYKMNYHISIFNIFCLKNTKIPKNQKKKLKMIWKVIKKEK
jgi:hypothetical protein